jgi:hypothetical protein
MAHYFCPLLYGFLLRPLATVIITSYRLDTGVVAQRLHVDEIARANAIYAIRKDEQRRSPLGRSASSLPTRESMCSYPTAASRSSRFAVLRNL